MNLKHKTNKRVTRSRFFLVMMLTGLLFLYGQSACFATTVALQWDADTDPTVTGYKVYYQADSSAQPFQGTGATQGPSPVNAQNQTTATIGGLDPNHAYYFAVTAYNASGVESAYSNIVAVPELVPPTVNNPVTTTSDTTPPTVSITTPSNNTAVSGAITISANANDNVGVTRVEFYENGSFLYATNVSTYSYTWNTTSVANGSYVLTAKAYDAAGNIGQSSNVNVTVSNNLSTAPGSTNGNGTFTITDALMALKISIGLVQPTPDQFSRYDVAPLVNGKSAPDGKIDIQDALLILRIVVGLETL